MVLLAKIHVRTLSHVEILLSPFLILMAFVLTDVDVSVIVKRVMGAEN